MRKHIQRVHRKIPKTKKFWLPVLVAVLTLQALAILYMWPKVDVSWKAINKDPNEDIQVKMLIKDSTTSLYSDAVIDAKEKRVYMPEVNIYLPLGQDTRQIKYHHTPADTQNSYPEEMMVSVKSQIETLPETLAQVSCVQRMLRVTLNSKDSQRYNEKFAGQVSLADGRNLFLYENSDKNCASRWVSFSPSDMSEIMKTAMSY